MNQVEGTGSFSVAGAGEVQRLSASSEQDDFLKLLVAQMRYQDPLNPLEGTDFTANLAQFRSLEQLQNIGSKLDQSVEADLLLARSINNTMAATLIGKTVRAVSDKVALGERGPVDINFELADRASQVTVEILSAGGEVLRTITAESLDAGFGSVAWDGRDRNGQRLPAGEYQVRISAVAPGGASVTVQPLTVGVVSGVRFIDGNPVLIVDGREIQFGSVLEILDEQDDSRDGSDSLFDRSIE